MTLSELASIGEFVSGMAVLISLIYLSLQVRQSQRTQRAAMHQARVERVTQASIGFLDPGFSSVLARAMAGATDLTATEVMQLFYFIRIQVVATDDALWQHDAGFLDTPSMEISVLTMKRLMANPALRATWILVRTQLAPAVRDRMDRMVEETPLAAPLDWAVAWREAYAQLKVGV